MLPNPVLTSVRFKKKINRHIKARLFTNQSSYSAYQVTNDHLTDKYEMSVIHVKYN